MHIIFIRRHTIRFKNPKNPLCKHQTQIYVLFADPFMSKTTNFYTIPRISLE